MTAFLIRQFFQGLIVLVLATGMIYFVLTLIPGGPLTGLRLGNSKITQVDVNRLGYQMGINDLQGCDYPWYDPYFKWLFSPEKKGVDIAIGDVHIKGGGHLDRRLGSVRLSSRTGGRSWSLSASGCPSP